MPKSLKGEKRPADVIGAATKAACIATGEETGVFEGPPEKRAAAIELGRKVGASAPIPYRRSAGRRLHGRPQRSGALSSALWAAHPQHGEVLTSS